MGYLLGQGDPAPTHAFALSTRRSIRLLRFCLAFRTSARLSGNRFEAYSSSSAYLCYWAVFYDGGGRMSRGLWLMILSIGEMFKSTIHEYRIFEYSILVSTSSSSPQSRQSTLSHDPHPPSPSPHRTRNCAGRRGRRAARRRGVGYWQA